MRSGITAPALNQRVTTATAHTFEEFRTAVSESFVPLQVTTDKPDPFWGRIRSSSAEEVHVYEVTAGRHTVERTPELIARGDRHYYKLSLQLAGTGMLIQDNREAILQPGDLAIYDTHRPYTLVFDDDFRTMVLMCSQNLIEIPVEMVRQLTAVRMSGKEGMAGMVAPFLAQLAGNLEQFSGVMGGRLAHSALDLMTTMVAYELGVAGHSGNEREALVLNIHEYITNNLASTDLGPGQIAAAHFISTRHLHGLFHEQGTTVSSWIRTHRLDRCRRDLMNPVYFHLPVAGIASRWGFNDAAHFSRVFKAAYAQSPSELRMVARTPR